MKIAIEGMDGVGKSTVAKKIAKEFDMIYLEKPLSELFGFDNVDGMDILLAVSNKIYQFDDERIKAWFFGLGNIYTYLQYCDKDIVTDRHFVSNYFWNGSERSDKIFENMMDIIGIPDLTIILYASVETRLQRLYERDPDDYDLRDPEKHVLGYDKMIAFLEKYNMPYCVVDTENKDIDSVYQEVSVLINNYKDKERVKKICYPL